MADPTISKGKWALILGASSGFGAAASLALARTGFDIVGVHLDRKATLGNADQAVAAIRQQGRRAIFFNLNAADPIRRTEIIQACRQEFQADPDRPGIQVVLHSLAFGSLKPFIAPEGGNPIKPADMSMTLEVMAHSLVYWVQELLAAGLLPHGAMIFAMTSSGSHRVWESYGAVSAAKAALEAHIRQLAVELAPLGISANALRAGVTDTPAARRIPGIERMFARAVEVNPAGRLTTPEDVARVIAALATSGCTWLTGNVIGVDGGEDLTA